MYLISNVFTTVTTAYHDLELALHFLDLILSLDEIFAVQVAICPHSLIQVLLLLQTSLAFHNLHTPWHTSVLQKKWLAHQAELCNSNLEAYVQIQVNTTVRY